MKLFKETMSSSYSGPNRIQKALLAFLWYGDPEKRPVVPVLTESDWDELAKEARRHGVAPLLRHKLQNIVPAVDIPRRAREDLAKAYLANAAANSRRFYYLGEALRALSKAKVPVIVLKGAYLAHAVYTNTGLRSMSDVDLLVDRDDLLRVEKVLLTLGGIPEDCHRVIAKDNHHFGYKMPHSGLLIEIHWALSSRFSLQVDMEGLWKRAVPITITQAPALAFSPEDLLLHLVLHMAIHTHDMRIRMLCDIGEIVRRFGLELDWQEIGAHARQWGICRAVYLIMRMVQELLEVSVPSSWLASVQPKEFEERYFTLACQRILTGHMNGNLIKSRQTAQLWGPKKIRRKIGLIRESLLLPRKSLAIKYPAPANSWRIYLYYPVRLKDVFVKHGTTLWRLAYGDPKTRAAAKCENETTDLREWMMPG